MVMTIISFVPFLYSTIRGKGSPMFQNVTRSEDFDCLLSPGIT